MIRPSWIQQDHVSTIKYNWLSNCFPSCKTAVRCGPDVVWPRKQSEAKGKSWKLLKQFSKVSKVLPLSVAVFCQVPQLTYQSQLPEVVVAGWGTWLCSVLQMKASVVEEKTGRGSTRGAGVSLGVSQATGSPAKVAAHLRQIRELQSAQYEQR